MEQRGGGEMRKERIEERLAALEINQFDAAARAGRGTHFIYDFMIGRKKSFKGDGPIRLAQALECSIEYLTGESDEIGVPPLADAVLRSAGGGGIPFGGIVEAGTYRRPGAVRGAVPKVPVAPHPGFPPNAQRFYVVRGGALDARGIIEGMALTVVDAAVAGDLQNGAIVVIEHARGNGRDMEVSARELQYFPDRTEFRIASRTEALPALVLRDGKVVGDTGKIRIVGLVVSASLIL